VKEEQPVGGKKQRRRILPKRGKRKEGEAMGGMGRSLFQQERGKVQHKGIRIDAKKGKPVCLEKNGESV